MSPTLGHREFYNIGQPYTNGRCIVYGDGEMGWYDYVLIDSQGLTEARSNLQYGSPEIALRDALIKASKGQAMRDELRDRPEAALASAPQPSFDRRFADMLIGILGDVQDELGFTDEEKLCANGSAEIVAAIRELKERAASAPPSAPVGVDEVRPDYRPAFDLPTTAAEALAWLTQQGNPTCMTFSAAKAKRAAELLGAALQQTETDPVTAAALAELNRAVQKFPTWPTDPLHAVAVLGEEFGELTKAVLQSVYEPHKVKPGDVRTEAVQVAAMALRFLRSLHSYEFTPGAQHEQPALSQQPAAPSGEAVAWLRMKPDGTPDWAEDCIGSDDRFLDHELASDGYYLQPLYAAPQQPAAGEEIMVNAAHDVYTLPLQPSGLLSGPRFVVHVPGPRQPAAVDGRIAIEPGERLFQFDSKQEWINHASIIWRGHGVRSEDTVCVDALGRLVNIGKHFADAERDRAYPIVVYRLRADMNRNTGAAQQQEVPRG